MGISGPHGGTDRNTHSKCSFLIPLSCFLQTNALPLLLFLTLTVLVTTIDAQWEGMGDVGSARYGPALLPPCPTIRVLSYCN